MGSLVLILLTSCNIRRKGSTKDSCWQTILNVAYLWWFAITHHRYASFRFLLSYQQSCQIILYNIWKNQNDLGFLSADQLNDVCLIRFAFRPVRDSFRLFAVLSKNYGMIWKSNSGIGIVLLQTHSAHYIKKWYMMTRYTYGYLCGHWC